MMEGRFREDLFYRINVMNITIPPLREQRERILPLSKYFFDLYKMRYERSILPLSSKAMGVFEEYDWPGNIRELENIIRRIIILEEEEKILQDLINKKLEDGVRPGAFKDFSPNGLVPCLINSVRDFGNLSFFNGQGI